MSDRYLKKISSGIVYPYTPIIAKRSDMVECDIEGKPLSAPVQQELKLEEPKAEEKPAAKVKSLKATAAPKADAKKK